MTKRPTWSPLKHHIGTSLVVQWLRLRSSTAGGRGSIPGQGTKIPHASRRGQKKKKVVFSCCLNIPANRLWAPQPGDQVPQCDKVAPCHKFFFLPSSDFDVVTFKHASVDPPDSWSSHLLTGPHALCCPPPWCSPRVVPSWPDMTVSVGPVNIVGFVFPWASSLPPLMAAPDWSSHKKI